MKKIAWFTAICLAIITVILILWEFRIAFLLFIISLVISAVLRPIVDQLVVHGFKHGLALLLTYLVIISVMVGLALVLGGPLFTELQAITHDLPGSFAQLKDQWQKGTPFEQTIANNFQDINSLFLTITGNQWSVQYFFVATLGSIDFIVKVIIVFVLSIYWSADQEHFKRLWLSVLPMEWRTRSRDAWLNIEFEIGSYLRSEITQSVLTVLFLGVGYQLIGLKYPILLALIGAVGWLIVWFGGLIAVIPALIRKSVDGPALNSGLNGVKRLSAERAIVDKRPRPAGRRATLRLPRIVEVCQIQELH